MKRANRVQINLNDPVTSLVIPDGLENHQVFHVNKYTAGIRVVKKDVTKFTNGMKCVICHNPHSFN